MFNLFWDQILLSTIPVRTFFVSECGGGGYILEEEGCSGSNCGEG